jgi:transposase
LPAFWHVSWENGFMGYNFAGGADGEQVFLLPPDPREWLPPQHLAWAMLRAARELDITPFLAAYRADGQGRPAYHPRMMAALIMYCYAKGIRSSRAIEMATFDDVGARVICGGLHPDHATNAGFVRRHGEPVRGLLVASLVACAEEGLVRVDVTAGDGTKVKANASMAANATADQLGLGIAELEKLLQAEVAAWTGEACAADEAEDALFGGRDDGPPAGGSRSGGPKRTAQRLARRQAAQAKLTAEEQARSQQAEAARAEKIAKLAAQKEYLAARAAHEQAKAGARIADWERRAAEKAAAGSAKQPDGRRPVPPQEHRDVRNARAAAARAAKALDDAAAARVPEPGRAPKVNVTDPSSRVMPAKNGGFGQLFNVQALACPGQICLAISRHDSPVDVQALHPLLEQGAANLAAAGITETAGKSLFDAGYASDANFTAPCQAELYVAVTREARQTGKSAAGRGPAALQSWQDMAARLDTPEGQEIYKQRKAIIEPLFAQLFARFGRTLNYRGAMADTELQLWAAVHNTVKAIRARARREHREHRERQATARQLAAAAV